MQDHDDFDFEDRPGIPAPLPPGEHVLWQGRPDKWGMAKNAFHIRKVGIYFCLLVGLQLFAAFRGASDADASLASLALTGLLVLIGMFILGALAWMTAHVTIYTLTNRRILIRFGVALQMTINLPFAQIKAASLRVGKDGLGDIPLVLKDTRRVNYLVLWPHVRAWHFVAPQPMLRCLRDSEHVAKLIADVARAQIPADTMLHIDQPVPVAGSAVVTAKVADGTKKALHAEPVAS